MAEKTNLNPKIIKEVMDFVSKIQSQGNHIEKAIIFGSYAKGNPKPWSDIDLCLVSPNFGKDTIEEAKYLGLQSLATTPRIETVPYSPKDFDNLQDPLLWEIKKNGIPLV